MTQQPPKSDTPPATGTTAKRPLALMDASAIVVASIIGIGIFFNPAKVAARAGDAPTMFAAWIVGGLIAIIGGLTFSELGAMLPKTGGQFVVLQAAFGRRLGLTYTTSIVATTNAGALAILAILCVENAAVAAGRVLSAGEAQAGALVALAIVWGLNAAGVKLSARALRVQVVLKLLILLGVVATAVWVWGPGAEGVAPIVAVPMASQRTSFAVVLLPIFFSYGGFQQLTWTAGEVSNPGRNLPRGLMIGIGVVIVGYLAVNAAMYALLGIDGMAQDPLVAARAVGRAFPWGGRAVAAGVAISALGTIHAIMLTSPRQLVALANNGLAPAFLGRRSAATNAPVAATTALAICAVAYTVIAGKERVDSMLDAVVALDWLFMGLSGVAVIVLRYTMRDAPRPFRVPLYPWIPGAFAACAFVVAFSPLFDPVNWMPPLIAFAGTAVVYTLACVFVRNPPEQSSGRTEQEPD